MPGLAGDVVRVARDHGGTLAEVPEVERARVELYYGERLRRVRRLTDARSHLARAVDAFSRLGAIPWGDRAEARLRASGGAARRADGASLAELTPRELQVALAIPDGATNREAERRLLLSAKTVAFHLNNVYRKLGIASRVELAVLLSTDGTTERAT